MSKTVDLYKKINGKVEKIDFTSNASAIKYGDSSNVKDKLDSLSNLATTTSDGLMSKEDKDKLDSLKTYNMLTSAPTTTGWYRFAKIAADNILSAKAAVTVYITLNKYFNSSPGENYYLIYSSTVKNDGCKFNLLNGNHNTTNNIKKIRSVYDDTNKCLWFELYNTDSTSNGLNIKIDILKATTVTIVSLESTQKTVDGCTVLAEMDLYDTNGAVGAAMHDSEGNVIADNIMDLKMLGYTVPKEMPVRNYIDSDGVYHQRVGRINLGSLDWEKNDDTDENDHLFFTRSTDIKNSKCNGKAVYKKFNGVTGADYSNDWEVVLNDSIYSVTYIRVPTCSNRFEVSKELSGVYLYYELASEIVKKMEGYESIVNINTILSNNIGKCKNLLNPTLATTTLNGVTCTNNGDGTYTLNGTATDIAKFVIVSNINLKNGYKIIGAPAESKWNTYMLKINGVGTAYNDDLLITQDISSYIWIEVVKDYTCNDAIFKPMITTNLDATYDDFVPYSGNGDTLTEDVSHVNTSISLIGKCKNLITTSIPTTTSNGITCTDNSDGTYTFSNGVTCTDNGDGTYTLNGTASGSNDMYINLVNPVLKNGIRYKFVGCPVGGTANGSFKINCSGAGDDIGSGITFTGSIGLIRIIIKAGYTCNNLLFKPMITTNLSATYDDFVPYSGSGSTLIEDVANINTSISTINTKLENISDKVSQVYDESNECLKFVFK